MTKCIKESRLIVESLIFGLVTTIIIASIAYTTASFVKIHQNKVTTIDFTAVKNWGNNDTTW